MACFRSLQIFSRGQTDKRFQRLCTILILLFLYYWPSCTVPPCSENILKKISILILLLSSISSPATHPTNLPRRTIRTDIIGCRSLPCSWTSSGVQTFLNLFPLYETCKFFPASLQFHKHERSLHPSYSIPRRRGTWFGINQTY